MNVLFAFYDLISDQTGCVIAEISTLLTVITDIVAIIKGGPVPFIKLH